MSVIDRTPPPLPRPARSEGNQGAAWRNLILVAGLILAARLALHLGIPLPACPLRAATAIPCPFCGGTRAVAALAQFDFSGAFGWNPLVALGATVGFVWLALGVVQPPLPRLLQQRGTVWLGTPWVRALLASVLLANWVYLCCLPR